LAREENHVKDNDLSLSSLLSRSEHQVRRVDSHVLASRNREPVGNSIGPNNKQKH